MKQTCASCQTELPEGAPGNRCPRCLFAIGLDDSLQEGAAPLGVPPPNPNPVAEKPGDRIGRYKLLQQIGEGGCGVVYMAEQEEPVRRRVALKIIKLGLETKSVIARFEAERQALALMDHPNIAKVFDGGVTGAVAAGVSPAVEPGVPPGGQGVAGPSSPEVSQRHPGGKMPPSTAGGPPAATIPGRPYFVMELVRGIKITEYCDQHELSMRERLELFIKVCQAVQHAHQKGIIHRDLKPSNILVTVNDGLAVPKVIDFGVAKATEQRLTDKTILTEFHAFIGTPAYMSPEQAEMSSLDIDTRSDIYSLGVLLYELLTGVTPFDHQDLLQSGLDEMRRIIREKEPERPSTRLAARMQGRKGEKEKGSSETSAAAAPPSPPASGGEGRGEEGASSVRAAPLPNSLPARSSRGEGEDLRRAGQAKALNPQLKLLSTDLDWIVMKCLEKDRSRRYETANGLAADLQRHLDNEPVVARPPSTAYRFQKLVRRNKLAFAALVAVSLTLLAGIAVSSWQAVRATRAEQSARRQAEIAREQESIARQQSETAQAVKEFLTENLLGAGMSLFRFAESHAIAPETTRALLNHAAYKLEGQFTNQPLIEAEIRMAIAFATVQLGDYTNAIPQVERALEIRRPLLGPQHSDTLDAIAALVNVKYQLGQKQEARKLLAEALAVVRSSTNGPSEGAAHVLARQGSVLHTENHSTEAVSYFQQALAMYAQSLGSKGSQRRNLMRTKGNLAYATQQAGQWQEAEKLWRELVEQEWRDNGPDYPVTVQMQFALGRLLIERQRVEEGQPLVERAASFNQKRLGTNHPNTLDVQYWLGQAYEQQGDVDGAAALYADIFPRMVQHWPRYTAVFCCREMANFFIRHRRYEEARAAYSAMSAAWGARPAETQSDFEELIAITAGARGWSAAAEVCRAHRDLFATSLSVWRLKATALFHAGDREGYRYAAGKALSLAAPTNSLEDQRTILTIAVLGWSALSPEQVTQCEAILPSLERELSRPSTNRHGRVHRTIGALQLRLGRTGEAMEHLEQAIASLSGIERARVLVLQALCFQRLGRLEEARQALADADGIMKSSFPDPLPKYEGLLEHWQLYELMLFREAQALLAGAEQKP